MLAMLPLRNVMAADESTCELHDQASMELADHGMHMAHVMIEDIAIDAEESNDCCCCAGSMSCTSDCGIGTSVPLISQSAMNLPLSNGTAFYTHVSNNLVIRDLAPPVRPPASL